MENSLATYPERFLATPHIFGRIKPQGVVLHHSCGSWNGDIGWLTEDPKNTVGVAYHCLVNRDGERVVFAGYTQKVRHAGVSSWRGRDYCNGFTLGVAVTGDTYSRTIGPQEADSVAEWVVTRLREFGLTEADITTHRAISPGRKNDPSPEAEKLILEAVSRRLAV